MHAEILMKAKDVVLTNLHIPYLLQAEYVEPGLHTMGEAHVGAMQSMLVEWHCSELEEYCR